MRDYQAMPDYHANTYFRHWMNLETFMVCLDEVRSVRKVNVERYRPDLGREKAGIVPGLEIRFVSGTPVEIDYVKEEHRDQAYGAIWEGIKKMGEGGK